MTRDQAQARADQLNREAPDRAEHRWTVRDRGDGDWQVVKITVSGLRFDTAPLHTATEKRPQPEVPPDPRPMIIQLIPPFGPA